MNSAVRGKAVCGRCGAKIICVVKNTTTARWECKNTTCGYTVHISDGRFLAAVDGLLDALAHTPEALTACIPQTPTHGWILCVRDGDGSLSYMDGWREALEESWWQAR